MKTYLTIAAIVVAIAVGFCAGLMVHPLSGYAQATKVTPKEPKASADEFRSDVIHYPDLPTVELVKGSNSRLVSGEQSMLSFLKMDANSYFAPHRHPQEQIMTVLEGECDEIIEGKLYHVKKGDVIILPPNIEHGAYIGSQDVQVIDVFGYPRSDYLLKMTQKMAEMNTKK
jgi:quercetin dioxygenase-like cupin family protein